MFSVKSGRLYFSRRGETVCVYAQGKDGIRVQSTMNAAYDPVDWALTGAEQATPVVSVEENCAELTNGRLKVTIDRLGKRRFSATANSFWKNITAVTNTICRTRPR